MVEKSSVKFLYRLRNVRPELEKEIDALLMLLVSKNMVEKSSVKFLYRLRNVRPELEKEIDALLMLLVTEKMKEDDDFGFEKIKKENYI